jgi:hypothetical protein
MNNIAEMMRAQERERKGKNIVAVIIGLPFLIVGLVIFFAIASIA